MISSLRGMRDLLPETSIVYEFVVKTCCEVAQKYGFEPIYTPLLEETRLFKRSVGESSDIVGKEMYQFIDKGGNDVCLRPEGTAGVVRSFIENKMDKAGGIRKFYYHGAMFRYERPQKGRFRQFNQFAVESFGQSDVREDASVILLLNDILKALGIKTYIKLNSLGCPKCMPNFRQKLVEFLEQNDEICDDCKRRKDTNPIRVLDCKNEHCQQIYKNAPSLHEHLCDECKEDFSKLRAILDDFGLKYELDEKLVRGLDYYSKTAFEFISDEIGAQSSIAGGGRYDRLVEYLDGKPTFAVGFAMGLDRLLELVKMPESGRNGLYVGALFDGGVDEIFKLGTLKRANSKVFIEYKSRSLKAHLKQADNKNALWFACIGEDEFAKGQVWLKNLENKEEKTILIEDFLKEDYV